VKEYGRGAMGMDDGLYDGDGSLDLTEKCSEREGSVLAAASRWIPRPTAASSLRQCSNGAGAIHDAVNDALLK
jgi:hypothetical protein